MVWCTRRRLLLHAAFFATLALCCVLYMYLSATASNKTTTVVRKTKFDMVVFPTSVPRWIRAQTNCRPHLSIAYLKTYKTASSMVQNIVLRYAERHGLSVALPARETVFHDSLSIRRELIFKYVKDVDNFSVLANHGRYGTQIHSLMQEDAKYVTSIREPASQFESIYHYFKLTQELEPVFDWFLEDSYPSYDAMLRRNVTFIAKNLVKNPNMYCLGLEPCSFNNKSVVLSKIKEIDSKFDLVLIADRMEESLILLKHLMCWSTDDVVSLLTNRRMQRTHMTSSQRESIRKWSSADALLYDHFIARLERQIQNFGEHRMASEVNDLRRRSEYWKDRCLMEKAGQGKEVKLSALVKGFSLKENSEECTRLVWVDNTYTAFLKDKAMRLHGQLLAQAQRSELDKKFGKRKH